MTQIRCRSALSGVSTGSAGAGDARDVAEPRELRDVSACLADDLVVRVDRLAVRAGILGGLYPLQGSSINNKAVYNASMESLKNRLLLGRGDGGGIISDGIDMMHAGGLFGCDTRGRPCFGVATNLSQQYALFGLASQLPPPSRAAIRPQHTSLSIRCT